MPAHTPAISLAWRIDRLHATVGELSTRVSTCCIPRYGKSASLRNSRDGTLDALPVDNNELRGGAK